MYHVIWEVAFIATQEENVTQQSPSSVSLLGQRLRLWVNIETALGECHVFVDVLAQSIQQTQC